MCSSCNDSSSSAHLFLLLEAALCSIAYLLLRKKNGYQLPPGPRGLLILGNLLMLGDLPHHNLCELSKKYGPIMSVRLGLVPTVVVSLPEMAELFLKTHDIVFASRPKVQAADYMAHGQRGMAFSEYGPYWRNVRKLCTVHLLGNSKIDSFKSMRQEEVMCVVKSMKDLTESSGNGDVVVDVSEKLGNPILNPMCTGKMT